MSLSSHWNFREHQQAVQIRQFMHKCARSAHFQASKIIFLLNVSTHNPCLSIHFTALPRKAKGLHLHSFVHSFFHSLLTGKFARAAGAALWHPALQDTRSGDDKYINPESCQFLGALLPVQPCPHQLCSSTHLPQPRPS